MLRRVHLHGPLRALHAGPVEIDAASPWDAIEGVTLQLEGFKPNPLTGRRRIQAVGFDTVESLQQAHPEVVDIHLLPSLTFEKNGGLIEVVVGLALVAAAFIPGIGVIAMNMLISAGITAVAGGLMQLLAPAPKNTVETRSKYLNVNQNTVAIGTPIPLHYGLCKIGGQILSMEVVAKAQPLK